MEKNLAIIGASYLQLPLIEKAKEMGYNHLYFSTYSVLKVARTMYRELGFTVTDSYDDEEVGNGVKEEIWEKDI